MKKNYNAPFMAVVPMMPFAAVMAGSGGLQNSGQGTSKVPEDGDGFVVSD